VHPVKNTNRQRLDCWCVSFSKLDCVSTLGCVVLCLATSLAAPTIGGYTHYPNEWEGTPLHLNEYSAHHHPNECRVHHHPSRYRVHAIIPTIGGYVGWHSSLSQRVGGYTVRVSSRRFRCDALFCSITRCNMLPRGQPLGQHRTSDRIRWTTTGEPHSTCVATVVFFLVFAKTNLNPFILLVIVVV
jgi:hypothetical protein